VGLTPGARCSPLPRWLAAPVVLCHAKQGTIFQLKCSGFGVPSFQRRLPKWENIMTQGQLIQALADKCEITKKTSKDLLTKFTETAISEVKKNGLFVVPGLGRLVRVDRKARMGRNPATGESMKIPAKKVVKFRIAKAARDAIVPGKAKKGIA
jgi:DNA-binding protein HU-beta